MREMRNERNERTGNGAGGMTMNAGEILMRARAQAKLVRRLSEQLKEQDPGPRRAALDGLPKGHGGLARGLDVQIEKRDALRRILTRECEIRREYEHAAREAMERMKPEQYAFCALYYVGALSLEETADAMDRSVRQCARYKTEIEHGQKVS